MSFDLAGYTFEGTWSSTQNIQARAGIYAVYCKAAEAWTLLDVGEAGDVRGRLDNHDRKECWLRNCRGGTIQYAVRYTPDLHQSGRMQTEQDIRVKRSDVRCGAR